MTKNRKMIYLSLLVAGGVALHLVESLIPIPFPVPGAKLGLANIVSLLAIALYGTREGLEVNILRCLIGSLLGGSMSSLLYSLSGAVSSTIMMGIAYTYFKNAFSLVGISIIGGVTHNIAQVTVASLILSTFGLFSYLPFLMVVGLLTGVFTGFAAGFARNNLAINLGQLETTGKRR
ncbi:Gx transporter family protein [Thermosediminibacter oceani]|uniref:Heptaprenyl diphosphate synthase component I n=1 Tax=Thermosediminibacter oceani (strain ATCC BAA-1034 / DSM 16646 / JW/IW-1228P) TaxID=555079 RepID=D9S275_THEOJ|nr:Gx transporter family protein [Thermosediminibacter oceani]ADL07502.1 Heptaprenyl diphosphate synthase component I [Thermosediminibacter oceani DSM 16646]